MNEDYISNDENMMNKKLTTLISYLYFVNSGQIKCSEDGSHFRPNHHAKAALIISKFADEQIKNTEEAFLYRALKRNLPSFASKYQVGEPLTRIRDIAHRNDIP
jgi:phosphoglucan,water dikinase